MSRTREEWEAEAEEHNPEILFWDGFDDAIIGFARCCGSPTVLAYSYQKCIDVLMAGGLMDYEDAVEYFEFNTVGAYAGPGTPICVDDL